MLNTLSVIKENDKTCISVAWDVLHNLANLPNYHWNLKQGNKDLILMPSWFTDWAAPQGWLYWTFIQTVTSKLVLFHSYGKNTT